MNNVHLVGGLDIAELVVFTFFGFFLGLVIYLRREDRREGYPLEDEVSGRQESLGGFFFMPGPKTFLLPEGGTKTVPLVERDEFTAANALVGGAGLVPTGDPLTSGIGPAAWVNRLDIPDRTHDGHLKIVPMRVAPAFGIDANDRDPRGMTVTGSDGAVAGVVTDIWVDQAERSIRYLEVDVAGRGTPPVANDTTPAMPGDPAAVPKVAGAGGVLLPMAMATVGRDGVNTDSITGAQFAGAPGTALPDTVTRLEEEKIVAYFGAGYLYSTPGRAEPYL